MAGLNGVRAGLVVVRDGEFLVSMPYDGFMRWSNNIYDAKLFDRYRLARMIADQEGGSLMKLCPVTGEKVNL